MFGANFVKIACVVWTLKQAIDKQIFSKNHFVGFNTIYPTKTQNPFFYDHFYIIFLYDTLVDVRKYKYFLVC